MKKIRQWVGLMVVLAVALVPIVALGADVDVKYTGPSGQGAILYKASATGITNLLFTSGGVSNLNIVAGKGNVALATNNLNTTVAGLGSSTASLNTAVAALGSATGVLNTAMTAANAATGALNTAVAAANAATGSLNTAVAAANSATGVLNLAVIAANAATGVLNTSVGTLNTATGVQNTAISGLNAATGSLNTVDGTLNSATGVLNTAVAAANAATGSLNTAVTANTAATGSLNTVVGALGSATGVLNTAVTAANAATNYLNANVWGAPGLSTSTVALVATAEIRAKTVSGNNLLAYRVLHIWASDTSMGTPNTNNIASLSLNGGTNVTTVTAKSDYWYLTSSTGSCSAVVTADAAGTKYIMVGDGSQVGSSAITFE